MGIVIDLRARRLRRAGGARGAAGGKGYKKAVVCGQCGEPHPIVRLPGGEERCVTAFFDGANWFCRNRGCRRAWIQGEEG